MSFHLLGIFGAGLVTFVTPCVLPLVPVYLSALVGGDIRTVGTRGRGQLVARAALFSLGFVGVFTLLGLTASTIGGFLRAHAAAIQVAGALLILVFGLKFLGVIRIPLLDRIVRGDDTRLETRFGGVNALVMGVFFAAGWSPCVGPVLGSVLTYTASATSDPLAGAGYLATYGSGLALPLVLTAAFAQAGVRFLGRIKPHLHRIEQGIGVLLVIVAGSLLRDQARALSAPSVVSPAPVLHAVAADGDRLPVMLELYAKDCPICRRMAPIVDGIASQCDRHRVRVERLDVSEPANRSLAGTYRLVGVPTFVFLDRQGAEVARLVGEQTDQALRQALSALRGEPCPGVGKLPAVTDAPLTFPVQAPGDAVTCHSPGPRGGGAGAGGPDCATAVGAP